MKGHTIDKCYRVHGFPPGYRNKGRGGQPHQAEAALVPNQSATVVPGQSFSDIPKFALSQAQSQCQELMKQVAMLSSQFSEMGTNSVDSQSSQALAPSAGPQVAHAVTQSTDSYPQASTFAAFDPQATTFAALHRMAGTPSNSLEHSVFSADFTTSSLVSSQDWISDTGATDHMVHSISFFTSITSIVSLVVFLPNGHKAVVTHIRTIQLTSTLSF